MAKLPQIIPVTDLRQDAAAVLRRVRNSREPLIITQRGRAAAVILSVEEYERENSERQVLRVLARGEKEIAAGEGFDLDTVLAGPMLSWQKIRSESSVHGVRAHPVSHCHCLHLPRQSQRSLSLSQRRGAAATAVSYVGSARSRISGPAVSPGHHCAL